MKAVMLSMYKEVMGRGLQETIVSSKAVPKVLDMKYRSEFKYGFANRGCLHCAILKALHRCQEKNPLSQGYAIFSLKCFK